MFFEKYKIILKTYSLYYLAGVLWILGTKYFYSQAGSDDLLWILAPTTWWVQVLGAPVFEYQPGLGYVNHALRFVIAPSCSGVQFMLILGAMLIFSFIHHLKTHVGRSIWLFFSLSSSYILTILVNGLRILIAIYLPGLFTEARLWNRYVTPERLHSMIGVAVYFSALLVVYSLANRLFRLIEKGANTDTRQVADSVIKTTPSLTASMANCVSPLFWYLFIVLGIPLLNGAVTKNSQDFGEYTLLIMTVCGVIIMVSAVIRMLGKVLTEK